MDAGTVAIAQLRGLGWFAAGMESACAGTSAGAAGAFRAAFLGCFLLSFAAGCCRLDPRSIRSAFKQPPNLDRAFGNRRALSVGGVFGIQSSTGPFSGSRFCSIVPIAHPNTHRFRGIVSRSSGQAFVFKDAGNRADPSRLNFAGIFISSPSQK